MIFEVPSNSSQSVTQQWGCQPCSALQQGCLAAGAAPKLLAGYDSVLMTARSHSWTQPAQAAGHLCLASDETASKQFIQYKSFPACLFNWQGALKLIGSSRVQTFGQQRAAGWVGVFHVQILRFQSLWVCYCYNIMLKQMGMQKPGKHSPYHRACTQVLFRSKVCDAVAVPRPDVGKVGFGFRDDRLGSRMRIRPGSIQILDD